MLLPHFIWQWLNTCSPRGILRYLKHRKIIAKNSYFKGLGAENSRCFILCNGPSVNQQDLLWLKDEVVLTVSSGYLHKQFSAITPEFHLVPQITYGLMREEDVVAWFKEMDTHLGSAKLILSDTEYDLVHKHKLFPKRQVFYLSMSKIFGSSKYQKFDLTKMLPVVMSAPIMCLMVAIYMGYKKIYLLGTEHDSFRTSEYHYAFKPKVFYVKDLHVKDNGQLEGSLYDTLKSSTLLWEQYRTVKNIADTKHIEIYNATLGGALDEFERVDLSTLQNQT